MSGTVLAVLGSSIIWSITYLISLYFVSYSFSFGIIPKTLRKKTNSINLTITILLILLISIYIPGLLFKTGGIMEKGNGVAWGCYIEDTFYIILFLWGAAFTITSLLLILGLIKPGLLRFSKRDKLIYSYLIHNFVTFLMVIIIDVSIEVQTSIINLSGIDSSCW